MACRYTYKGKTYEAHEFDDVLRALPAEVAAQFVLGRDSRRGNLVPNAPFIGKTDAWVSLALKRIIKMAVDEGYDKVAFVTGEQSADRYSLRKQVRSIEWSPFTVAGGNMPGGTHVIIDTPAGLARFNVDGNGVIESAPNPGILRGEQIEGKRLDDVVGKAAAEKIMGAYRGKLEGEGLNIGGEGMVAFYDKIVPSVLKDVLRKVGGGQIGTVDIEPRDKALGRYSIRQEADGRWQIVEGERETQSPANWFKDRAEAQKVADQRNVLEQRTAPPQPGFTITPAMREKAASGLPLFAVDRSTTTPDNAERGRADPDDRRAVELLQANLQRRQPGVVLDAVPARAGEAGGQSGPGLDRAGIAAFTRALWGERVVWFRSERRFAAGLADPQQPGLIFLNVESPYPHMAVLGHELTHSLRTQHAGLYNQLRARILTVARDDLSDRHSQLRAALRRAGFQGADEVSNDYLEEEYIADVVGDNFMDPEFWTLLTKGQPSGFKRVVQAVLDWLDKVIARLTGMGRDTMPFNTQAYIKDWKAARSAVAEAMRQFSGAEVGAVTEGEVKASVDTDTDAFRKWFGDSKVVDKDGKPLVVYHGTVASEPIKAFAGDRGVGWFSEVTDLASIYAQVYDPSAEDNAIYPVFLSIKNPLVLGHFDMNDQPIRVRRAAQRLGVDTKDFDASMVHDIVASREFMDAIEAAGYDGVKVRENGHWTWAPIRSAQIKSAIGNRGTFDAGNPDVRMSVDRGGSLKPSTAILDAIMRKAGGSLLARLTSPGYDKLLTLLDGAGKAIGGDVYLYAKAGLASDYGLTPDYRRARHDMDTGVRKGTREAATIIERLQTLDRAQARIAYLWMQAKPDTETEQALMAQLPEESRQVMTDLKQRVDELGRQAVDLGLLSQETYERNAMAYLHRSYQKYETNNEAEKTARARSVRILGDQFKGRGLRHDVGMDAIGSADWWQRREAGIDTSLKGQKFHRLELRTLDDEATPDMVGDRRAQHGRLHKVVYWPVGEAIPSQYADWRNDGRWEARFFDKSGKVGMWRDFTLEERTMMGEIQEVRYSAAKTLLQATRDVETARLLAWVATNESVVSEDMIPKGHKVVKATESLTRAYLDTEWVQVPDAKIPDTGGLKRYGKLAGRYIPGPVWNDLRQISALTEQGDVARLFNALMTAWKISKTALSPATHTNNVMSNFIMADWADLQARHMAAALHAWVRHKDRGSLKADPVAKKLIEDYQDNGGDGGKFNEGELREDVAKELLEQLERDIATQPEAAKVTAAQVLDLLQHHEFRQAFAMIGMTRTAQVAGKPAKLLIKLYGREDELFRLAAFIKARDDGLSDHDAGQFARESFLDYSINAPWINAMRRTGFPFIAFTYRALPKFLRTVADKPWKVYKLLLLAGALNALGYAMSGGDEDEERALLPEEKAGKIWGILPKLLRMPWNDEHGSPVFLDVRRWIPVGDVVDTGSNHAAVPIPAPLLPGGPLVILAEVLGNKQWFTGKEITKETDTLAERYAKSAGYLWKSVAPNMPGIPGTYATDALMNADRGKTDVFGREQSLGQAALSSVGVKVAGYPKDTLLRNASIEARSQIAEIRRGMRDAGRQLTRKGITQAEYDEHIRGATAKIEKIGRELNEKVDRAGAR